MDIYIEREYVRYQKVGIKELQYGQNNKEGVWEMRVGQERNGEKRG